MRGIRNCRLLVFEDTKATTIITVLKISKEMCAHIYVRIDCALIVDCDTHHVPVCMVANITDAYPGWCKLVASMGDLAQACATQGAGEPLK